MQFQPFGLEPVDQNWGAMMGSSAPQLCTVLASDTLAYAVGDPVFFSTEPNELYPAGIIASGTVRSQIRGAEIGVIVAVAPGIPQSPMVGNTLITVPSGVKSGPSMVWVLPALRRRFLVAGDAQTPLRSRDIYWDPVKGRQQLLPTEQCVNNGDLFGDLTSYAAPIGGRSSRALDGTSFTTDHNATLHIEGLWQGMPLAPRSKYVVSFRPR